MSLAFDLHEVQRPDHGLVMEKTDVSHKQRAFHQSYGQLDVRILTRGKSLDKLDAYIRCRGASLMIRLSRSINVRVAGLNRQGNQSSRVCSATRGLKVS